MFKIILAMLLALPPLLVLVCTAPLVALLSIPSLLLLLFCKSKEHTTKATPDHVVITGGSSGIGLSIAKESIQRGVSRVTILARNPERLKQAKQELLQLQKETATSSKGNKTTEINALSVSVSDADALKKIAKDICKPGETTTLFHCAGTSWTTYFNEIETSKYHELVNTNQLGAMICTRAFLEYMSRGTIVLVSSAAGQVGIFGFAAYAPTKFALRGFAEVLHMELVDRPINVQIVFPSDTKTPDYEKELAMSPPETKALAAAIAPACPDEYVLFCLLLLFPFLLPSLTSSHACLPLCISIFAINKQSINTNM
jgi:3-dehydrosphinganine reductase